MMAKRPTRKRKVSSKRNLHQTRSTTRQAAVIASQNLSSSSASSPPATEPATNFVSIERGPGEFKRRPRGSSERIRQIIDAAADAVDVPCSVPGCNHPGFTYSILQTNQNRAKKHAKDPSTPLVPFDVPRRDDGTILWFSLYEWSNMNSEEPNYNNYNNFLRTVRTHFVFQITMKNCKEHKRYCPAILRERAQQALNNDNNPATSNHSYRKLWEALELTKGDSLPSTVL